MLRTRKNRDDDDGRTDIDDGEWQAAAVNEGNELKYSHLLGSPLERMRDMMVMVPSSRDMIYKSCALRK